LINRFKVIEGGKKNSDLDNLEFIDAKATNTRFMGVVGAIARWKKNDGSIITQIFHLDYEDYGIDGYNEFVDEDEEFIEKMLKKTTGGLGGDFVEISLEELIYLVSASLDVSYDACEYYEEINNSYDFLLKKNEIDVNGLFSKIGPGSSDENETLNYFIMRVIGRDEDTIRFFSRDNYDENWLKTVDLASTLIKNSNELIETEENLKRFEVMSLVDYRNKYKMITSIIELEEDEDGCFIKDFNIRNEMPISSYEAAFLLKKKEYINIYQILNDDFIFNFDDEKPELMVNAHHNGDLYTEFNNTNSHVKDKIYYLNGDVFANYYITDSNQLVVFSFKEENIEKVDEYFSGNDKYAGMLYSIGSLVSDSTIVYSFIMSDYEDFYDFLQEK
jgi:hypothetical protein